MTVSNYCPTMPPTHDTFVVSDDEMDMVYGDEFRFVPKTRHQIIDYCSQIPGGEPNDTSEYEQDKVPSSSELQPSKSLHAILQSLLVTLTEVCISRILMYCN